MNQYLYLQASQNRPKFDTYKGIPIYTFIGLHDKCFDLIEKYKFDRNKKFLILGSGAGAFDQRLYDNGYKNITSVDLSKDNYLAILPINFIERDLNSDFSDLGKYDYIISLEVVEHLENPALFFRSINKLLVKDGFLIVSTPNVENTFARIRFFLTGNLQCFTKFDLDTNGHITPLFNHILNFFFQMSEFSIIEKTYNKKVWSVELRSGTLLKRLFLIPLYIFSKLLKNQDCGDSNIYILTKFN